MINYTKLYHFILLFACVFILNTQVDAQSQRFKVTHLTPDDGLSHSRVWKILQDKQGFIWFATDYGLNKYDGYKFTVYLNNEKDSTSLAENYIWDMMLDKKGNIWLATNGNGFDIFDVKTERFIHHKKNPNNKNSLSDNEVRTFFADSRGEVWISCGITGGMVDCYNEATGNFTHYTLPVPQKSKSQYRIRTINETKDGKLWFGMSYGGLFQLDRTTNKYKQYLPKSDDSTSLPNDRVVALYVDKSEKLWICTYTYLCYYNPLKDNFIRFKNDSLDGKRLFETMSADANENFWISSTKGGLCFFNKQTGRFTDYYNEPNNPNSLMGDNVGGVFVDNTGIVWANSIGKGVDKIDFNAYKFRFYKHDEKDANTITANLIRALTFDKQNRLWLGFMYDGVDMLEKHKKTGNFSGNGKTNSLSENTISALFMDSFGSLWVGNSNYGLNRIDFATDYEQSKNYKITNYKTDRKTLKYPFPTVKAIVEDKAGTIWIGGELGIDKYDRQNDKFIHYQGSTDKDALCDSRTQFMYVDSKGFLWIGTWEGLSRMIPSTSESKKLSHEKRMEKFETFVSFRKNSADTASISNNKVISMCEAKDGTLWFGTYGGGLNCLLKIPENQNDASKYKFLHFNELNGLPNNVVFGIEEDNEGFIWLSTNNGLAKLNPKTGKFRVYTEKDGLQNNQFFWGAYGKSKDGELIFGGINGYNAFYPNEVKDLDFEPPVIITSFKIHNEEVPVSNKSLRAESS